MPIIINLTVVYADWKEVWCNAVKRNWTITYFTSVSLLNCNRRTRLNLLLTKKTPSHREGVSYKI